MKLRVCTLFSGYDSQCMALDRLKEKHPEFDYELVAWAEIDKYAIQAHNAVYPQWGDRNYGDVSKIDWSQVPDFDLLTYSSPCQDFSNAGKQAGGAEGSGTRSSLLWEVRRAIIAKKPKYLLMENVAALVSDKFIGTFNQWQLQLERYGYTNFSQVLNAKDYGVPQNRERIFMVSVLDCEQAFYFPAPIPLTKRLKDVLETEVDEKYYLKGDALEGFRANDKTGKGAVNVVGELQAGNRWGKSIRQQNFVIGTDRCSMAITAKHLMHEFKIAEPQIDIVGEVNKGLSGKVYAADGLSPTITASEGVKYNTKVVEPQVLGLVRDKKGNVVKRPVVDVANCVTSGKRDNTQNYVIEPAIGVHPLSRKKEFRGFDKEKSPALRSTDYKCPHCVLTGYCIRKLTERECFRLMGVIDTDSDKIRTAVSKSQCYKLAGNSIVVDVMVGIFEQLLIGNKNTNQQLEIF